MKIETKIIQKGLMEILIKTDARIKFVNLTEEVKDFVARHNINCGICHVFSQHTTCGIAIIEDESGSILDITKSVEKIAPAKQEYQHNILACDQNGHAHVRTAYIGQSKSLPIINNELALGPYQSIVAIDFDDTKPRERKIIVMLAKTEL